MSICVIDGERCDLGDYCSSCPDVEKIISSREVQLSKVEAMIEKIESASKMEILDFDFEPCFQLLRELEASMKGYVDTVEKRYKPSIEATSREFITVLGI